MMSHRNRVVHLYRFFALRQQKLHNYTVLIILLRRSLWLYRWRGTWKDKRNNKRRRVPTKGGGIFVRRNFNQLSSSIFILNIFLNLKTINKTMKRKQILNTKLCKNKKNLSLKSSCFTKIMTGETKLHLLENFAQKLS